MADDDYNESDEFHGKYVRVRGRVSRRGEVTWSPALRTEKGSQQQPGEGEVRTRGAAVAPSHGGDYVVALLDYRNQVLETAAVTPDFFAQNQEWATFVARLPYNPHVQAIVLRSGERELGRLQVPTDRPYFTLLHPNEDDFIDPTGILHLHWAGHDTEHQMTFFVRYSHNGRDWIRPGVNLHQNDYYLDLAQMPGGKRCVIEVIATNGYRTSYAKTRHFEVPVKPPELLLGETDGPILFAQGFSREEGPITGEAISWRADDKVVHLGGSLDIHTLPKGIHQISVSISTAGGDERTELVGTFDSATGAQIGQIGL
jgi:hypothetical protein